MRESRVRACENKTKQTDECLPREAGPYPRLLLLPLAARMGHGDEGKGRHPSGFPWLLIV